MAKKRKGQAKRVAAKPPNAATSVADAGDTAPMADAGDTAPKADAGETAPKANAGATATQAAKPKPKPLPSARIDSGDSVSIGKQRRGTIRAKREVRGREAVVSAGPAPDPVFFFGFEVAWAKLVLVRVLFFVLLGLDALMQISHAPRYGAGGFNVAQLPLLDAVAPGRELYSVAQLVNCYLFVLAACGVATRVVLPIATLIYGWLYFSSHLDSYQHHYLVWLLLVIACFVPWERLTETKPATRVRTWAVRVMLIQLALLYLWAAVSKMNSAWLDGRTLDAQLGGSIESFIKSTVGYSGAAWLVVLTELTLAATIWWRRGWYIAAPLGLALHIGILKTGFEIGLFAWFMIALYVLVIPDRVWVWLAERQPMRAIRTTSAAVAKAFYGSARFAVWVISAGLAAVLAMMCRFEDGPAVGLGLVLALLVGTVFAVLRRRTRVAWLAVAHLLAFVMWTAVDRTTATASDYYRFWGGSSRRLGDVQTAEAAYRQMTEVAPDDGNGFYQLGRLLLARDAGDAGLAALTRAQTLEPLRARAYVAEARWLATHGKRDEAIAKAREATIVEPADSDANALLDSLLKPP